MGARRLCIEAEALCELSFAGRKPHPIDAVLSQKLELLSKKNDEEFWNKFLHDTSYFLSTSDMERIYRLTDDAEVIDIYENTTDSRVDQAVSLAIWNSYDPSYKVMVRDVSIHTIHILLQISNQNPKFLTYWMPTSAVKAFDENELGLLIKLENKLLFLNALEIKSGALRKYPEKTSNLRATFEKKYSVSLPILRKKIKGKLSEIIRKVATGPAPISLLDVSLSFAAESNTLMIIRLLMMIFIKSLLAICVFVFLTKHLFYTRICFGNYSSVMISIMFIATEFFILLRFTFPGIYWQMSNAVNLLFIVAIMSIQSHLRIKNSHPPSTLVIFSQWLVLLIYSERYFIYSELSLLLAYNSLAVFVIIFVINNEFLSCWAKLFIKKLSWLFSWSISLIVAALIIVLADSKEISRIKETTGWNVIIRYSSFVLIAHLVLLYINMFRRKNIIPSSAKGLDHA